jgi:hypothetical protein
VFREVFSAAVRFARDDLVPDDAGPDSLSGQLIAALRGSDKVRESDKAGRQLAAAHTWPLAAAAHLNFYRALIAQGRAVGLDQRMIRV